MISSAGSRLKKKSSLGEAKRTERRQRKSGSVIYLFLPAEMVGSYREGMRALTAEALQCRADREKRNVSASPSVTSALAIGARLTRRQLADAMTQPFTAGRIRVVRPFIISLCTGGDLA
jgi:hypothetical protein